MISPGKIAVDTPVRTGLIGCGNWGRRRVKHILEHTDAEQTEFVAICDPLPEAYAAVKPVFTAYGRPLPPNQPDLDRFLSEYADQLDAVFIMTPHVFHHDQAKACLEAGLDVLLEKPMVMTTSEAASLIETRNRTGKHLVVAFQGSLSPQVRAAVQMRRSGQLGELLSISATIWQHWRDRNIATWRGEPEVSGGGMLFDTGAHMLNTVADLADQDFVEVAAWLETRGTSVDLIGTIMCRLESGALVTMHACGDTVQTCKSDIRVFCTKAILYTGAWGERLEIQRSGDEGFSPVELPPSSGVWEQFLAVRSGSIPNPSPPEVGLRMARLWDAIRFSAARGGVPVRCG